MTNSTQLLGGRSAIGQQRSLTPRSVVVHQQRSEHDERESKFIRLRNILILAVVGLYIVLNQGFMLVRIPPTLDGGVPVGEILLILSLLTVNYRHVVPRMSQALPLLPLLMFWAYGFTHMAMDFLDHGMWALRDGIQIIESLFLIVGFAFAGSRQSRSLFFAWLSLILTIGAAYNLSIIWVDRVTEWSPKIVSPNGSIGTIFGEYAFGYIIVITFAFLLLVCYEKKRYLFLLAVVALGFAITIYQQRTSYGIVALAFLFLIFCRRQHWQTPAIFGCVFLAVLIGLNLSGIEIKGYKGAPINLEFLKDHAMSSLGEANEEAGWVVQGSASGVSLRLRWWGDILYQLTTSPTNFLFGLGYGIPLTDSFWEKGVPLREPHNSYISMFARLGFIGLAAWCLVHYYLLSAYVKAYRWTGQPGLKYLQDYLLVIMVYFIGVWVTAIGEDPLEKAFFVIPYYFFWGVVLRLAAAARRENERKRRHRRRRRHRAIGQAVPEPALAAARGGTLNLRSGRHCGFYPPAALAKQ